MKRSVKLALFLIVFFALPFAQALAADLQADGDCSLADAIIAANTDSPSGGCPAGDGADTITITPAAASQGAVTLAAPLPDITSNIRIEGSGFTISGNDAHRVFRIASQGHLSLHQIAITKGNAPLDIQKDGIDYALGGGIYVDEGGSLTVTSSVITGNQAASGGGGIFVFTGGNANIIDSNINRNHADYGGGIYVLTDGKANITDSALNRNTSNVAGSAVYVFGKVNITDSRIKDNQARYGSAVYVYGKANITDSTISGNKAKYGGGVYVYRTGTANIIDSTLSENNAAYGGSVLVLGKANITDSFISGSRANYGGGIHVHTNGTANINKTYISNNHADYGGGMSVYSGGTAHIANSAVISNSAKFAGGGLYIYGGSCADETSTVNDAESNDAPKTDAAEDAVDEAEAVNEAAEVQSQPENALPCQQKSCLGLA